MITTLEQFKELLQFAEGKDIKEVLKEWGGSSLYIPSYKSTFRDDDIREEFKSGTNIGEICRKYSVSRKQLDRIVNQNKKLKQLKLLF